MADTLNPRQRLCINSCLWPAAASSPLSFFHSNSDLTLAVKRILTFQEIFVIGACSLLTIVIQYIMMMKGQRLTLIHHHLAKTLLAIIKGLHSGTDVEIVSAFPTWFRKWIGVTISPVQKLCLFCLLCQNLFYGPNRNTYRRKTLFLFCLVSFLNCSTSTTVVKLRQTFLIVSSKSLGQTKKQNFTVVCLL